MARDLTAKQRNSVLQHWCSQIARESQDLDALSRIGDRALQDRDVCTDAVLQSMVRAELERYRTDIEYSARLRTQEGATKPRPQKQGPAPSQRANAGLLRSRAEDDQDLDAEFVSLPEPPAPPPPPNPDKAAFRQLVEHLSEAVKRGDEDSAGNLFAQIGALHQRGGGVVGAAELAEYEQCVTNLRAQLNDHRREIATLTEQAQAAAQRGDAREAVTLVRRLTAIHVAHPRLLDEAGLAKIRASVTRANESHEDRITTQKLMEREREVAIEMKRLASAVSEFHRAVFSHPECGAEFRAAARVYLRTLRQIRLHEKDWLAEFVLELGDVLANWNVPPPGASDQIDRFLEKVRGALHRIHAAMGAIDSRPRSRKEP